MVLRGCQANPVGPPKDTWSYPPPCKPELADGVQMYCVRFLRLTPAYRRVTFGRPFRRPCSRRRPSDIGVHTDLDECVIHYLHAQAGGVVAGDVAAGNHRREGARKECGKDSVCSQEGRV